MVVEINHHEKDIIYGEEIMLGQRIEFPIELGVYEEGVVKEFCEDSGRITVVDDDGGHWKGYEYQTVLITRASNQLSNTAINSFGKTKCKNHE